MVSLKLMAQKPFVPFALLIGLMAILFCLFASLTPGKISQSAAAIGEGGGRDFPVYWAAWRIFQAGESPYSLKYTQSLRSDSVTAEDVLHNPPWCLWLIAPVGWLPYSAALNAWLILNFLCIPLGVFLCSKIYQHPLPKPRALFLLCVFAPAFSCWYFGQLTLFLTIITLLLILCLQKQWQWGIGFCLAVMTIKPHIYYLFAFIVGLYALRGLRWRVFMGFFITATIMSLPFILNSNAIAEWFSWLQSGQAALWQTTTLSTWFRIYLVTESGIPPAWPLYFFPGFSIIVSSVWFFKRSKKPIDWGQLSIPLIALSLLTAPYSWAYDFCLLIGWHVLMLTAGRRQSLTFPLIAIFSTLMFLIQTAWLDGDLHLLVWFPFIVLASWSALRWSESNTSDIHESTHI
jgi:hypothetical protein